MLRKSGARKRNASAGAGSKIRNVTAVVETGVVVCGRVAGGRVRARDLSLTG